MEVCRHPDPDGTISQRLSSISMYVVILVITIRYSYFDLQRHQGIGDDISLAQHLGRAMVVRSCN